MNEGGISPEIEVKPRDKDFQKTEEVSETNNEILKSKCLLIESKSTILLSLNEYNFLRTLFIESQTELESKIEESSQKANEEFGSLVNTHKMLLKRTEDPYFVGLEEKMTSRGIMKELFSLEEDQKPKFTLFFIMLRR